MAESDEAVAGLRAMGPVQVKVQWTRLNPTRTMTIVLKGGRYFGVQWYAERWRCDNVEIVSGESDDFAVQSRAPWERLQAEWWRRLGYYVLAAPLNWIAWHGWYRWRQVSEGEEL